MCRKLLESLKRPINHPAIKHQVSCSGYLQVCWEKFNQYFEVEGRYVPVELDYPVMSVDRIEEYADENTIGVSCV